MSKFKINNEIFIVKEDSIAHDEKTFRIIFNRYYKGLVTYAYGYLYDKDASEDLVQEVFIYFWEHAVSLNIQTSLQSYLYAMVRNKCLNYLKSFKITDNLEVLELYTNLTTDYEFDSSSEDEEEKIYNQILKIVDRLPKQMQQIAKLKFLDNYKYAEIAAELNISVNTVKTQLKRAKLKIAEFVTILLILTQIKN